MQVELSYIFHNSFLLRTPDKTFLFDYPDGQFLQAGEPAYVADAVKGADLLVCVSHSHKDHFSPTIQDFGRLAARTHFVLSYDVVEMHPEFDPVESGRPDVTVIEPEQWSEIGDLRILGLESTDLGVGFLIQYAGKTIYFGGDVAEWDWEGADERSRKFSREHFGNTLAILSPYAVDLAFSNTDGRLPNWAGAARFIGDIRPRFFVPMHSFGRLESIRKFCSEAAAPAEVGLLTYEGLGVFARLEL